MCKFIKFEWLLVMFTCSFKDKEHWSKTYMYHKPKIMSFRTFAREERKRKENDEDNDEKLALAELVCKMK